MTLETLLYWAIGLYIVGMASASLASIGKVRPYLPLAKGAYLVATFIIACILLAKFYYAQSWSITDFEKGFLLTIVILGAVYIFAEVIFSIGFAPIILSGISLVLAVFSLVFRRVQSPESEGSFVLQGHTFLVFLALAAFSFSCVLSLLFLMENRLIKAKTIRPLLFRLPSLELSSRLNNVALIIGTTAYAAGIVKGIIYFNLEHPDKRVTAEPTYIMSVAVLVLYSLIIFRRRKFLEGRTRVVWATILAYILFLCVVIFVHSQLLRGMG